MYQRYRKAKCGGMTSFLEIEEAMVFKRGPESNSHQIAFQASEPLITLHFRASLTSKHIHYTHPSTSQGGRRCAKQELNMLTTRSSIISR